MLFRARCKAVKNRYSYVDFAIHGMSKRKTRLEQLEDQRNQLISELDIYRLLEDEEEIDRLLAKLKILNDMIRLAKQN